MRNYKHTKSIFKKSKIKKSHVLYLLKKIAIKDELIQILESYRISNQSIFVDKLRNDLILKQKKEDELIQRILQLEHNLHICSQRNNTLHSENKNLIDKLKYIYGQS